MYGGSGVADAVPDEKLCPCTLEQNQCLKQVCNWVSISG